MKLGLFWVYHIFRDKCVGFTIKISCETLRFPGNTRFPRDSPTLPWTSNKQVMNKSWTCCKQVISKSWIIWWTSHEQFVNKLWTSHKHVMNKSCICHEQVVNKSWTSHEQVMNKLWTCCYTGGSWDFIIVKSHEQIVVLDVKQQSLRPESWSAGVHDGQAKS